MSGVAHYVHDRPYKMALHKSLTHVPMSFNAAKLIHQIAAMADPMYELLEAFRSGEIDRCLPAWPSPDAWKQYYYNHKALTRGIDEALPGMLRLGGLAAQDALDESRTVSLAARLDPESVKEELRRMGSPQEWRRAFIVGIRWQIRDYKRNLLRIGHELTTGEYERNPEDFDQVLRGHPAVYFYFRVVLPGFLVFQTVPIRELRRLKHAKAAAEQAKAVERLVRMDPQAERLDEVRDWTNSDNGATRQERVKRVRAWSLQGLGGGKFERKKLKEILGAAIQVAVKRAGPYLDFVNPGMQPASITPAQVRDLFHAVARDRAGRGRVASLQTDPDIVDMQPGSWATQLRRYRPLVDHLFEQPGRLRSG